MEVLTRESIEILSKDVFELKNFQLVRIDCYVMKFKIIIARINGYFLVNVMKRMLRERDSSTKQSEGNRFRDGS